MRLLEGKIAVITGGTRGLGLEIARAYGREGAGLVVASRSAESVARTVAELRASGMRAEGLACDVADLAQVQALADHAARAFGVFDVWVNNAALSAPYGPTAAIPPEKFEAAVKTEVLGTYHGSVVALRHFLARRSGKLINLLGAGERKPVPYQNAYASSKAWVRVFTLALAQEYRDSGVGIFAFQPGLMPTELLTRPEVVQGYEARLKVLPAILRLLGNPPQVPARKAVWIASAATDGRTGLEVRLGGPLRYLGGALREGLLRLSGRAAPLEPLDIISVPPAD